MDFYYAEYVNNAVLMDQAREVLHYVRQKYKTGLITNGKNLVQHGKIDQLAIRDAFDFIIVSEEAGVKKPDPLIFEMALERLQLSAEECIYVGDHPVNDIEASASVGMNPIWIKVNQPWRDHITAKPIHEIERLSELLGII